MLICRTRKHCYYLQNLVQQQARLFNEHSTCCISHGLFAYACLVFALLMVEKMRSTTNWCYLSVLPTFNKCKHIPESTYPPDIFPHAPAVSNMICSTVVLIYISNPSVSVTQEDYLCPCNCAPLCRTFRRTNTSPIVDNELIITRIVCDPTKV